MPTPLRILLLQLNHYIENRMFLVVMSGMLLGWFFPGLSNWKSTVPFLFGYMTLVTALNISWGEIRAVAVYPVPILVIWSLVHLVMPFISLITSTIFLPAGSPFIVGAALVMMIPIGIVSIIWTNVSEGEPPLALTTVAVDSLLSPLVLSASVWLFLGKAVPFDARSLMLGLFWMIVLPTIVGISLHDMSRGQLGPDWAHLNGPLSKFFLTLVVAINIAAARDILIGFKASVAGLMLLLFFQSSLGFLLGFGTGRLLGYPPTRIRTMTFCSGLRNISAGIVIALRYFSPAVAIPVILTIILQQPMAALAQKLMLGKRIKGGLENSPSELT
jgi:predicted Na+-dependent transporter